MAEDVIKTATKQVVAPIVKYSIADLKAVSSKVFGCNPEKSLTELFMVSLYRLTELRK